MAHRTRSHSPRYAAVTPLVAILMVVVIAMVAFAVDIGYLAVVKAQAQNAADAGSLAGVAKLTERLKVAPIVAGIPTQTAEDLRLAREEAKTFAARNRVGNLAADVRDADVTIGYLADPYDQSTETLLPGGWPARPYNAVRVSVSRDSDHTGGPLDLFFARVLGIRQANIGAASTSAFAMGTVTPRGNQGSYRGGLLPFTYQVDQWNAMLAASVVGQVTAPTGISFLTADDYAVDANSTGPSGVRFASDGRFEINLYPNRTTSGNFGTINFSKSKVGNSTSVLRDLILNGPDADDWPDLPEIAAATRTAPVNANGDPGLSAGMESAVRSIIGEPRFLPLYSTVSGNGNNTFYQIVGVVPITITAVHFQGSKNSSITIQPRVIADRSLIGTGRIHFDLTPSASPNPLIIGSRGLVR